MTKLIYKSRPIKRKRRTKAEMKALKGGLYAILHDDHPQTVRGVFYQATVRGFIDKTEPGYKVVQRCLVEMRRRGLLPFNYIADSTRWMRKPETHSDVEAVLFDAWRYYRKAIWNSQAVKEEKSWVNPPSKEYIDKETGKKKYWPIVHIEDKDRYWKFQDWCKDQLEGVFDTPIAVPEPEPEQDSKPF